MSVHPRVLYIPFMFVFLYTPDFRAGTVNVYVHTLGYSLELYLSGIMHVMNEILACRSSSMEFNCSLLYIYLYFCASVKAPYVILPGYMSVSKEVMPKTFSGGVGA